MTPLKLLEGFILITFDSEDMIEAGHLDNIQNHFVKIAYDELTLKAFKFFSRRKQ